MEAWQKPGEVNTGTAPGLSQHLPAGWGSPGVSGTQLQPGTEHDPGTRMMQTFMDTNSATAVSVSWHQPRAKAQPGQQIPKGGNVESNSIPAAVSLLSQALEPQQLPGLTAACSHSPWVLGSWLTQPLDTASSPSRKATLEPPVCWGAPSSGVLALMLPEMFLSPWVKSIHLPYFKPKGTYPSSPSS